ncbi:hypothetical protein [Chitinophaga defluvii]|uniref:Carboxypeptidase family protein n=1 Tax=Chitinophaga defluvii TaxID=3163343 RepID=A0ABV2TAY3_9BACT
MKYFLIAFLALTFLLSAQEASATNLRGRIVRYDPYSGRLFPLYNVRVDFWLWNGTQWLNVAYSVTNGDGFYFFNNVAPGYLFKVQVFNAYYPLQQPWSVVNVLPPYFQDIPQIST